MKIAKNYFFDLYYYFHREYILLKVGFSIKVLIEEYWMLKSLAKHDFQKLIFFETIGLINILHIYWSVFIYF
jgi:hypothetical protein